MTRDEIIKALRDMAKYPTVTLPRDCEALRIAADLLAQPEPEYLAFMDTPQRTWVGLTQTEVVDLLCEYNKLTGNVGWQQLIYMTEAKLKEKNT